MLRAGIDMMHVGGVGNDYFKVTSLDFVMTNGGKLMSSKRFRGSLRWKTQDESLRSRIWVVFESHRCGCIASVCFYFLYASLQPNRPISLNAMQEPKHNYAMLKWPGIGTLRDKMGKLYAQEKAQHHANM